MEQFYQTVKNSKILKNISKDGKWTVIVFVKNRDKLKYVMTNFCYYLSPLGWSFHILYKNNEDVEDIRENFDHINYIQTEKNSQEYFSPNFVFKLRGKPEKILFLDTDLWLNNDDIHKEAISNYCLGFLGKILCVDTLFFSQKEQNITYYTGNSVVEIDKAKGLEIMSRNQILSIIEELGFITKNTIVCPPKQHIQNERMLPTLEYIKEYKKIKGELPSDYFFTLFDGWREHTEPSNNKIFIRATENLLLNFLNKGSHMESGRFIKRKTSQVPDHIYIKLPFKVLSYCRHKGDTETVLIPDSDFLKAKGYIELKKEIDTENIPYNMKQNILYWRGNNNSIGYKAYSHNLFTQREMLVNLKSEWVDAEFSQTTEKKEFLKYKFLVDVDGEVNAWSGLFWKLYSGSLVFKIESHWEQWFYDKLHPWIHYIPVRGDLSDLQEQFKWALDHEESCINIIKNARSLTENLTYEKVLKEYVWK